LASEPTAASSKPEWTAFDSVSTCAVLWLWRWDVLANKISAAATPIAMPPPANKAFLQLFDAILIIYDSFFCLKFRFKTNSHDSIRSSGPRIKKRNPPSVNNINLTFVFLFGVQHLPTSFFLNHTCFWPGLSGGDQMGCGQRRESCLGGISQFLPNSRRAFWGKKFAAYSGARPLGNARVANMGTSPEKNTR
jgi:hypothetical protein